MVSTNVTGLVTNNIEYVVMVISQYFTASLDNSASHVYTSLGEYNMTVTVSNGLGSFSITYIIGVAYPIADSFTLTSNTPATFITGTPIMIRAVLIICHIINVIILV